MTKMMATIAAFVLLGGFSATTFAQEKPVWVDPNTRTAPEVVCTPWNTTPDGWCAAWYHFGDFKVAIKAIIQPDGKPNAAVVDYRQPVSGPNVACDPEKGVEGWCPIRFQFPSGDEVAVFAIVNPMDPKFNWVQTAVQMLGKRTQGVTQP